MTINERNRVYTKTFNFLISHKIKTCPLPLTEICTSLNIRLIPLSFITSSTNLTENDIFDIWGNEDGTVQSNTDKRNIKHHKISYNDQKPHGRIRFTIAEELSHIIFKHTDDKRFNIFSQSYNKSIYEYYDKQARMCAGILLCSPKFYYQNKANLSIQDIASICDISVQCAEIRCSVYDTYKTEIVNHPLYRFLPTSTRISM